MVRLPNHEVRANHHAPAPARFALHLRPFSPICRLASGFPGVIHTQVRRGDSRVGCSIRWRETANILRGGNNR